MIKQTTGAGLASLAIALLTTGCGDDATKNETTAQQPSRTGSTCRHEATKNPTGLPAGFPLPDEFTVTEVVKAGPTITVHGYWEGTMDDAFTGWKDAVAGASGYTPLGDEKETHDAEVFYKGEGRSGLVGLHDNCSEADTTRVNISSRPQ